MQDQIPQDWDHAFSVDYVSIRTEAWGLWHETIEEAIEFHETSVSSDTQCVVMASGRLMLMVDLDNGVKAMMSVGEDDWEPCYRV